MKSRRNFVFQLAIFAIIFAIIFDNAESLGRVYPRTKRQTGVSEDPGSPLFLTPLIECGRIEEARQRAKVEHHQMTNITSYAGYFTVNKIYNSNLFFWYFPAEVDSANAPVILYLEGGPGASSVFGLFLLNGPFDVTPSKSLEFRKNSWTAKHNVIYIDNPVGTGYSFTENDNGYATSQTQIGLELRKALVQYFKLFPTLRGNDFFITGESYAGKWVPALGRAIDEYNPTTVDNKINLKGLAIANGFTDPINQFKYGDYLYQLGLIDLNGRNEFYALENKVGDLIREKRFREATDMAGRLVDGDNPPTLFKNLTDYNYIFNYLETEGNIIVDHVYGWMQQLDVRRALHVGNTSFGGSAEKVVAALTIEATQSQADTVAYLLSRYRILIFTGQLDIVCAYPMVQNYLQHLSWPGAQDFSGAVRKPWRVGGELAGYTKVGGNLSDVLVRNAGHLVIGDQREWTLDLIEKFTRGREL